MLGRPLHAVPLVVYPLELVWIVEGSRDICDHPLSTELRLTALELASDIPNTCAGSTLSLFCRGNPAFSIRARGLGRGMLRLLMLIEARFLSSSGMPMIGSSERTGEPG